MLMIAALALTFLGLDGILLIIAKVVERPRPEHAKKVRTAACKTFRIAPARIRDLTGPRAEKTPPQNPSLKEKLNEHACAG